jgi:hypothetical protein
MTIIKNFYFLMTLQVSNSECWMWIYLYLNSFEWFTIQNSRMKFNPYNKFSIFKKLQLFLSIIDTFFKGKKYLLVTLWNWKKTKPKNFIALIYFLLFHFSQFLFAHLWDYSCSCYSYCSGFVVIEQINWWHFK